MTVTNVKVKVFVKGIQFWSEMHKQHTVYDSEYEYHLDWQVPAIAPKGHYDVTLTGYGSGGEVKKGKVFCVNAQMDL